MGSQEFQTTTDNSLLIKRVFSASDNTIPYRLVGSYEYAKALDALTSLVEISTLEEMYVYDRFLDERPEFTFFNGANTAFNLKPDLTKANPFERKTFDEQFKKKGLQWMIALAKIELAATLSLYGDPKFPFEEIAPGEFEMQQYLQLLSDDTVAHLKSLSGEPGFAEVLTPGRKADTWTLAYLRRLKLIKDMLNSLSRATGDEGAALVGNYRSELKQYERKLVRAVLKATAETTATESHVFNGIRERNTIGTFNSELECDDFIRRSFPDTVSEESGNGYPGSASPRSGSPGNSDSGG